VDFIRTEMVWPITHMVAPKENALACRECHVRDGGRLAGITGVYLPGRDRATWLDLIGWLAVAAMLAGALVHGGARIIAYRKR
jgi:hypothetical protein